MNYRPGIFVGLYLWSAALMATENFLMRASPGKVIQTKIEKIESLHVNEECFLHRQKCLRALQSGFSGHHKTVPPQDMQLGNPASTFCQMGGGVGVILEDQKRNEYDYCKVADKFLIDSWDLYKKYKQ